MGTKNLGSGNDFFRAHKEGGFLGIGDEWRSWTINGNDGNDTLIGGEKSDTIRGGNHNDDIYGMGGSDFLYGDAGDDFLSDTSKEMDVMYGGTGNDTYHISANDIVTENSNEGYDILIVQSDVVTSYTMPSNIEVLYASNGIRNVNGNSLNNAIYAAYREAGSKVTAFNQLDNTLEGFSGNDHIYAGEGQDVVGGGEHNDLLGGDNGNDRLFGDSGNDTLYGAQYFDYGFFAGGVYYPTDKAKFGKGEVDTLTGGTGNDSFVLGMSSVVFYDDGTTGNGAQDYGLIADFVVGQDKIVLNGSSSNYALATGSYSLGSSASETFIYRIKAGQASELIGVVQDVTGLSLSNTNQFSYA